MIDSHAHLNDEAFIDNLDEVLLDARKSGIKTIICPGWDLESSVKAIKIAEREDDVFASIGIHPENVKDAKDEDLLKIEELSSNKKVVAIGEIGLDYHYGKDTIELQKEYLLKQLALSSKKNLPVIIHLREATEDFLNIIKEHSEKTGKHEKIGVMHCYSGSTETMKILLDLGFYISFGGPVTFKNAKTVKEAALLCPLDRLLIETDSPYLAPHPLRGRVNTPKNVSLVLKEIAKIKGIDEKIIEENVEKNLYFLFNIKGE